MHVDIYSVYSLLVPKLADEQRLVTTPGLLHCDRVSSHYPWNHAHIGGWTFPLGHKNQIHWNCTWFRILCICPCNRSLPYSVRMVPILWPELILRSIWAPHDFVGHDDYKRCWPAQPWGDSENLQHPDWDIKSIWPLEKYQGSKWWFPWIIDNMKVK